MHHTRNGDLNIKTQTRNNRNYISYTVQIDKHGHVGETSCIILSDICHYDSFMPPSTI